jgi:hypothetical protein
MWNRDYIFWGAGSNKGVLEGRNSGATVDFREQIGVYVLYDENHKPIYIGQAGQGNARLFSRLKLHARGSLADRWHYFSWFGLLAVTPKSKKLSGWDDPRKRVKSSVRSMLNEIEGVLIAATEPAFNKQGARFRGIPLYKQVKHAKAGPIASREIYDLVHEVRDALAELQESTPRQRRRRKTQT